MGKPRPGSKEFGDRARRRLERLQNQGKTEREIASARDARQIAIRQATERATEDDAGLKRKRRK